MLEDKYRVNIIKNFREFMLESAGQVGKMVAMYHPSGVVHDHMGQTDSENAQEHLFQVVSEVDEYRKYFEEQRGPVIIYSKWGKKEEAFVKAVKSFNQYGIYNDYSECKMGRVGTLQKMMADNFKYCPKTVFSFDDAQKGLNLPVIAKAANSYDSKGVEKIEKWTDAEDRDEFDLFQEAINVEKEYRVIVFIGKRTRSTGVLMVLEKTPKNKKAKNLRVEEALSKEELKTSDNTKWRWTQANRDTFSSDFYKAIGEICSYLHTINPGMNFTGLDIAESDGKYYYIEHNMLPANLAGQSVMLYKAIYEDWYEKKVDPHTVQSMGAMSSEYLDRMNRTMPFKAGNSETANDVEIKWLQ